MSSTPISEDEHPEVDDETLSEVVRRPTRTAGDLSEVADASPGITTEDLARDLEAVASKRGVPTETELLADLLRRVHRLPTSPQSEARIGLAHRDDQRLRHPGLHGEKVPEDLLPLLVSPEWVEERKLRWGRHQPDDVPGVGGESITGDLMTKAW
jgi:hypothetical protein